MNLQLWNSLLSVKRWLPGAGLIFSICLTGNVKNQLAIVGHRVNLYEYQKFIFYRNRYTINVFHVGPWPLHQHHFLKYCIVFFHFIGCTVIHPPTHTHARAHEQTHHHHFITGVDIKRGYIVCMHLKYR